MNGLTLKEKLNHGDLDHALTRDEVMKILELLENEDMTKKLDEAREEGNETGKEEEFERLKTVYKEAVEECALYVSAGDALKKKLDELFDVED